jgi:hypothetical protein
MRIRILVILSAMLAFFAALIAAYLLLSAVLVKRQAAFDFAKLEKSAIQILLFGIAVGVTAMAIIEVLKRLLPIRAVYHIALLSKNLGRESFDFLAEAISGNRRRAIFFDLPIEQLSAQIGVVLDQIVAAIEVMPIVWDPLTERGFVGEHSISMKHRLELVNAVVGRPFFVLQQQEPLATPSGANEVPATPSGANEVPATPSEVNAELRRDMETALRSALDSRLDTLQLSVASGWKRVVRLSAALVSAASALALSVLSGVNYQVLLVALLAAFVVGGFFSWLSRDLVALVERWRR